MAVQTVNNGLINTNPVNYSGSAFDSLSDSGTYRGIFSDWFNAEGIAREDYMRSQQSADNQLQRDLYLNQVANKFNASEAQKQRDWQENMAGKQYQLAIDDMKKAGINPVLAYSQGGASFGSGSSASASNSRSAAPGNSTRGAADTSILSTILNIVAGAFTSGAMNSNRLAVQALRNSGNIEVANRYGVNNSYRDTKWRQWYDKKTKR